MSSRKKSISHSIHEETIHEGHFLEFRCGPFSWGSELAEVVAVGYIVYAFSETERLGKERARERRGAPQAGA